MKNKLVQVRNKIIGFLYRYILKPVFFMNDPEDVHDRMIVFGKFLGTNFLTRGLVSLMFGYENKSLEQNINGISFKNPIGLAAGFDKDAELTQILPSVGFGFAEIGSVTGYPCKGNPKPRLWRLPESQGLIVYYGLKNKGCEVVSAKLKKEKFEIPIGTSVAMTNCRENMDMELAVKDYAKAFQSFVEIGSYTTVNISCPNAEGGQPFVDSKKLDYLFSVLDKINTSKPIFIKISPDLSKEDLDLLLDVSRSHRVQGIICSNLTKKRDNPKIIDQDLPEKGGISGKPVQDLSDKMLSYIYKREKEHFVLVGCGGVFTSEDAYKKIRLGASLIQMITGMIFQGPQTISEINRGLDVLLKKDGFKNISEAVGVDVKKLLKLR